MAFLRKLFDSKQFTNKQSNSLQLKKYTLVLLPVGTSHSTTPKLTSLLCPRQLHARKWGI